MELKSTTLDNFKQPLCLLHYRMVTHNKSGSTSMEVGEGVGHCSPVSQAEQFWGAMSNFFGQQPTAKIKKLYLVGYLLN